MMFGLGVFAAWMGAGSAALAAYRSDRISVAVQGEGPDVVLVPGLSSSREVWASTVAGVPGYRYHLVQLNGFAGEPAAGNAEGAVVASAVEELARYIAEAGLNRPAVIGHSMGGTIGLMLAARHAGAVGRLMVVDMLPYMGDIYGGFGADPAKVRAAADAFRDRMLNATLAQYQAGQAQVIDTMVNDPAGKVMAKRHGAASDRTVSALAMHELIVTDLRPELAKITAPTTVLFVWGPAFPVTPEQLEAYYRLSYAGLKGATVKRIPDSAHFIMLDQPERFRAEVKAFLAS